MAPNGPKWRPFSNPAPLGNSGFAVTTFVSALHTGAIGIAAGAPPNVVTGLALFYGGFAQIMAGAWSFASNNAFGAVVFTSYGCYWMSYAATLIPGFGIADALDKVSPEVRGQSLAIFNLVWVIQTFIFLLGSLRSNWGTVGLLLFLLVTNLLTCIGNWSQNEHVLHASGYVGMFTAIIAWYNVAVDMFTKDTFYCQLPNPAIRWGSIPDAIEAAVQRPFFHDLSPQHHAPGRLDGRTPGNHYDYVSTIPKKMMDSYNDSGSMKKIDSRVGTSNLNNASTSNTSVSISNNSNNSNNIASSSVSGTGASNSNNSLSRLDNEYHVKIASAINIPPRIPPSNTNNSSSNSS